MNDLGKKQWLIADGYMSDAQNGDFVSHEAVCVFSLSEETARISITVYFEDREPLKGFVAECKSERTNHIRLDKIENNEGIKIPHEVPYALLIESNVSIVCHAQHNSTLYKFLLIVIYTGVAGKYVLHLQKWITAGGYTKERECMIRKKRIIEYIFNIKPNLRKKSN